MSDAVDLELTRFETANPPALYIQARNGDFVAERVVYHSDIRSLRGERVSQAIDRMLRKATDEAVFDAQHRCLTLPATAYKVIS